MQLKEVMTRNVECVDPDTTLEAAAQRMRDLDVGPLPVCDHDMLAGMVTDRDIIVRGVAFGCDVLTTKVGDVMTKGVDFCYEDDDLEEAERMMQERQVRRLLVLNRDKRLVGIGRWGTWQQRPRTSGRSARPSDGFHRTAPDRRSHRA